MQPLPFILIIISIFTHAYWNYLIKSSRNKLVFTGLSKIAEIIIFAPGGIYYLLNANFQSEFLVLVGIAALITFANYYFLASAYKYGDLSLVYPVSRSSIIFLPVISYFFIGERIDEFGFAAISLIIVGTFVMHMESLDRRGVQTLFGNLSNKGSLFAILAAMAVAGYTLWDKVSITKMEPFVYFYLYNCLVGLGLNAVTAARFEKQEYKVEWKLNRSRIIQVGVLNSFTYILVLIALSMSKATYVGGLRQLSIVIGALLGYKLLGEKLGAPKLLGILLSIAGGMLIYQAR